MLKIGLTGGIGSGKSTVAQILETLNIAVYYSDDRAKWLVDNELHSNITAIFGTTDRKQIAQAVFNDRNLLEQLNKAVHPAVARDFMHWAEIQKGEYVVQEAAILVESGAYKMMDRVVVVCAPEELRLQRVMARDNFTEQQALSRIKAQLPQDELLSYADYIITADQTRLLIPQVIALHQKLTALTIRL